MSQAEGTGVWRVQVEQSTGEAGRPGGEHGDRPGATGGIWTFSQGQEEATEGFCPG